MPQRRIKKLFHNMGLWGRFSLVVIPGLLLLFGVFSFLSMRTIHDSTNRVLEERQVLADMAARDIDAIIAQGFYELEKATAFASFDPQAEDLSEEYHMLAHAYGRIGTFSLGVHFLNAQGEVVLTEPPDITLIGTDQAAEHHIHQVMDTGQRSISEPFIEQRTGRPAVAITIPIKNEQEQFISMLSGILDLSSPNMRRPIEQALQIGRTGHAEIVDSQGRVLVSTYPESFLKPGEHVSFYHRMFAEKKAGVETVPYENSGGSPAKHVMAFVPLSMANWGIALGGDAQETFAPVMRLRNSIILFGSLMLGVVLSATLIGTRRIIRPIQTLTRTAQTIGSGDLNTPISVYQGGEIGLLAQSLEEMRLKLRESMETMKRLDSLKSEFISSISHELRTPLGFIKGYVTTLLRPDIFPSQETQQEFLNIVREETEKLEELVENLLDTSRIQRGSFSIDKRPVDIAKLMSQVVEKAKAMTDHHSITLTLPLYPLQVNADPRRLEQVLYNLIDNAVKYSPEESPITLQAESDGDDLIISVSDRGEGIPHDRLPYLFDAFYRGDSPRAKKVGGSGLGLYICRGIVESHGGKIWAESAPGKGSTFYFTLPVKERSL